MLKCSVLAIGNEVVDGQIVNSNSSWVSNRLLDLGFIMTSHLAVKDELSDIHRGLSFLKTESALIIVSGGLGPTNDDCTRSAIAQWLGCPLLFEENQWEQIQNKLSQRGVQIRKEHRQQSFLPKGATVLENPFGVAPGFAVLYQSGGVVALPGPPGELKAMWKNSLEPWLAQFQSTKESEKLKKWICFGLAESEVQHRVKPLLHENPQIIGYGYRLSKPYVELKAWYSPEKEKGLQELFGKVSVCLESHYKGDSISTLRAPFFESLKKYNRVTIQDGFSKGLFFNFLKENKIHFELLNYWEFQNESHKENNGERCEESKNWDLRLNLNALDEFNIEVVINSEKWTFSTDRGISLNSKLGKLMVLEKMILADLF